MADEEKQEAELEEGTEAQAEDAPKKRKAPILAVGGIVGILGLAYALSLMAVPGKDKIKQLEGPFVAKLFEEKMNVNLPDSSHKRYLQFNLNCIYEAYDPAYFGARASDPLYLPLLRDALLMASSSTSLETVFEEDILLQKIREAIEPILFPVHIGSSTTAYDPDADSGLRAAKPAARSTFRGRYFEHVLKVDAKAKTLQLDDGPVLTFEGKETELEVRSAVGRTYLVDVSRLKEEFVGEINIGVQGEIRRILWEDLIVQ